MTRDPLSNRSRLASGIAELPDDAIAMIYGELKQIARRHLHNEAEGHTLQPTALLHEALIRLQHMDDLRNLDSKRFCAVASHIMRRVLVDHARKKKADKRGGQLIRVEMDHSQIPAASIPAVDLLDLDELLGQLSELNERHAHVIEMRFFAGLSVDETASLLDVSSATVKNDWRAARAWLLTRLQGSE